MKTTKAVIFDTLEEQKFYTIEACTAVSNFIKISIVTLVTFCLIPVAYLYNNLKTK